ncbi:MAG: tRNA (adenosine(37)-N6)-threonylcarbamoyltransferase complex dimerization subunit type 1 TsaB [candidate division KSB1 bacterium]|nr:tRNA (adenosine(37)-N6)-threonylcarbamoyltransferase complex dimerization subunit type 1 TsaB [candidate division KSB1 bacterium]MDZ7346767.1 tRNA (adenosine(37)-N6)-threonylcarbamoyltransferase complex dimerization subunit type 1 TsaB [candidate division KSB1 bacterium]
MNLLAIETSAQICAAALFLEGHLAAECRTNLKNAHASVLFHQIETVLHMAKTTASELSAVAVSIGPGSFTGLRIGLAAAKGLALAREIPLIGVPSLEAMVWRLPPVDQTIYVLRKSRADEYYLADYRFIGGKPQSIGKIQLLRGADLAAEFTGPCLIILDADGEAVKLPENCRVIPNFLPSAEAVGLAALPRFAAGDFMDLDASEPFYLQDFIAGKPRPLEATANAHT